MVRGARWELGSGKGEAGVGEGEGEGGGEGGDEKGKARYSGQGDINRPRDGLDLVCATAGLGGRGPMTRPTTMV